MYVRYLGGGVGHLEQFPPANNDDGVVYEYEVENEDILGTRDIKNDGSDEDEEGEDEDKDGEGGEDEDEDEDGEEGEDDSEDEDEDTGNVY